MQGAVCKKDEKTPSSPEGMHAGFPHAKNPHIYAEKESYPQKGVDNFFCEKWLYKAVFLENEAPAKNELSTSAKNALLC